MRSSPQREPAGPVSGPPTGSTVPVTSADIDTARYWTQVPGRAPDAARLRRIAELDTIMWSRPNQASLDAAASAAERGLKLALLSNAPPVSSGISTGSRGWRRAIPGSSAATSG
jgi:hypothetical protein